MKGGSGLMLKPWGYERRTPMFARIGDERQCFDAALYVFRAHEYLAMGNGLLVFAGWPLYRTTIPNTP